MHEASLIRRALRSVLDAAAAARAQRVTSVRLGLGITDELDGEAVRTMFGAFSQGSIAAGAGVEVIDLDPTTVCAACRAPVSVSDQPCPRCGSAGIAFDRPEGIAVLAVKVE